MPLRSAFKSAFQKAFDKLTQEKQLLVLKALEALAQYFRSGQASYGLHIKKLYGRGATETFEARVSADLRLVWVETEEEAVFSLIGGHEEVRRFLKNL